MRKASDRAGGFVPAVTVLVLVLGALIGGLLPLSMPLGLAAGGVLQTGQVEPSRWWLGAAGALTAFAILASVLRPRAWLWWLTVLASGIVLAVGLFVWRASLDQPPGSSPDAAPSKPKVGIMSALPLFWPEAPTPSVLMTQRAEGRRNPLVDTLGATAVDSIEAKTLSGLDALVLAQARLLQPAELVALDDWIRNGGRAVIFADPLLMWPSALSVGDPRRAPLTSLLDPLLAHWGLRLEAVAPGAQELRRIMLSDGHVLIVAGASRFSLAPDVANTASCMLVEKGLVALCRVGRGRVRLIADADLLDERLWLADARWPDHPEAHTSDIVGLVRGWSVDPLSGIADRAPRRATDDAALMAAMRLAILGAVAWVGLGWLGYSRLFGPRSRPSSTEEERIHR